MKSVAVTNIRWETDGEWVDLPSTVYMSLEVMSDDDTEETISDILSDKWGWLHNGFTWEEEEMGT